MLDGPRSCSHTSPESKAVVASAYKGTERAEPLSMRTAHNQNCPSSFLEAWFARWIFARFQTSEKFNTFAADWARFGCFVRVPLPLCGARPRGSRLLHDGEIYLPSSLPVEVDEHRTRTLVRRQNSLKLGRCAKTGNRHSVNRQLASPWWRWIETARWTVGLNPGVLPCCGPHP